MGYSSLVGNTGRPPEMDVKWDPSYSWSYILRSTTGLFAFNSKPMSAVLPFRESQGGCLDDSLTSILSVLCFLRILSTRYMLQSTYFLSTTP